MKLPVILRAATFALTIGLAGTAVAATPATAPASTQSFQISPPTSNYAANKGTTVNGTMKVTNLTGAPLTVNVGKQNFVANGEEGQIELVNNADPLYSLAPWFNIATPQLNIPGRGTVELHYSIAIPPNAEPGGRYGSITFSSIPPTLAPGQSGAAVQQTIGSIIFLRINGPAHEQLNVEQFSSGTGSSTTNWVTKTLFPSGPVDFLTRIKDTGNVHEKPTGTVTVKNMLGLTVAKLPLDSHFVIPQSIRRWYNTWDPKGLQIGRYTATLTATYAGNKTLTATTSFLIFPVKTAIIILVILIFLFFVIWRGRKRFARAFRILAGKE
jgi:hypothetical protein